MLCVTLILKGISGFRLLRFFWKNIFCEKNFITHPNLSKSAKLKKVVSIGPKLFAYSLYLANEFSQIRSILSSLLRLVLTLLYQLVLLIGLN